MSEQPAANEQSQDETAPMSVEEPATPTPEMPAQPASAYFPTAPASAPEAPAYPRTAPASAPETPAYPWPTPASAPEAPAYTPGTPDAASTPTAPVQEFPTPVVNSVPASNNNPYTDRNWGAPGGARPTATTSPYAVAAAPIGTSADDAAMREAEREARNRQLGTVIPPQEEYIQEILEKPDTDRPVNSIGLLILRVITAGVVGIRAFQMLANHQSAVDRLTIREAPSPEIIAWVEGGALVLIALMLLIGFGTRLAAVLLTAAAIANLAFMQWGAFSPLREGVEGLRGDFELMLTAAGLTLFMLGSGGWAVDGIRRTAKAMKSANF